MLNLLPCHNSFTPIAIDKMLSLLLFISSQIRLGVIWGHKTLVKKGEDYPPVQVQYSPDI